MAETTLNLKKSVVSEYWKKNSSRMARAISIMETVENWIQDEDEDVSQKINELSRALVKSSDLGITLNIDRLLFVMAYMSSGKAIRIMNWFDENFKKDLSLDFVYHAKDGIEDPVKSLLIDRLQTVKSLNLISSIFSQARTKKIDRILRDLNE